MFLSRTAIVWHINVRKYGPPLLSQVYVSIFANGISFLTFMQFGPLDRTNLNLCFRPLTCISILVSLDKFFTVEIKVLLSGSRISSTFLDTEKLITINKQRKRHIEPFRTSVFDLWLSTLVSLDRFFKVEKMFSRAESASLLLFGIRTN